MMHLVTSWTHQMIAWRYFNYKKTRIKLLRGLGDDGVCFAGSLEAQLTIFSDSDCVVGGGIQMTSKNWYHHADKGLPFKKSFLNNNFLDV